MVRPAHGGSLTPAPSITACAEKEVSMRLRNLLLLHLCILPCTTVIPACSGSDAAVDPNAIGSIQLPLQTTSTSGKIYRLRSARFDITGPTTASLTTPAPGVMDAELFLRTTLQSGNYSMLLQPGWKLWRIAADGSEGMVTGTLLSVNPATFQVTNGVETPVIYSFQVVDDGTI